MKTSLKVLAFTALTTFAVSATAGGHNLVPADVNDPVSLRINLMQNVGAATGVASGMMKGEIPFDALTAQSVLATINTAALGMEGLYPAGMEENMRSSAGPNVWANAEGFKAAIAKFIADSGAAKDAKPADLAAFQSVFSTVGGNCKACHQDFRIRR